jgi:hypothetical protein
MTDITQSEMELTMINLLNNLDDDILLKMIEVDKLKDFCYNLSLDMHTLSPYDIEINC